MQIGNDVIVAVESWSLRASPRSVWTFCSVTDVQGRHGFGETACSHSDRVERAIVEIGMSLVGHATTRSSALLTKASRADAIVIRAVSALDQAIVDLSAQQRGVGVCAFLGGAQRSTVTLYSNLNRGLRDRSAVAFAARAREAAQAGFSSVKIAPFDDVSPDCCDTEADRAPIRTGLERVEAVCAAVGTHTNVFVDLHWRFSERAAYEVIPSLARMGVTWIECPIAESPATLDAIARLRSRANTCGARLAGADEIDDPEFFRAIIASNAYDILMPDIKHNGGVLATRELADAALAAGAHVSLHNPSGPVAHAHSVHLCAVLGTDLPLEYQYGETTAPVAEFAVASSLRPERGRVSLQQGAGVGVSRDLPVPRARRNISAEVRLAKGST